MFCQMIDELCRSGLLGEREARRFVRRGHFVHEAGHHGDTWLSLELLFADPRRLQRAAARLAGSLVQQGANVVCGPLVGGALVGQWIAHELGVGFVYAEPERESSASEKRYAIPRELGAALSSGRAIVVDDVINAGSATLACVREIESWGGRVVAVAGLIVRESTAPEMRQHLRMPVEALLHLPWNTWPSADCHLCHSGLELSRSPEAPSFGWGRHE